MSIDYRRLLGDGKCAMCRKPLGTIFRRIRVDHGAIDARAAQRQHALGTFLGSHQLAEVMGPGETLVRFTEDLDKDATEVLLVHDLCMAGRPMDVAMLLESARSRRRTDEALKDRHEDRAERDANEGTR